MEHYLHLVHPYGFFDWRNDTDVLKWKKKILEHLKVLHEVDNKIITYRAFFDFDDPETREVGAMMNLVNLAFLKNPDNSFILPDDGIPFDEAAPKCDLQNASLMSLDEEIVEYMNENRSVSSYIAGGYSKSVFNFALWFNNYICPAAVLTDLVVYDNDEDEHNFLDKLFRLDVEAKSLSGLEAEIKYQ